MENTAWAMQLACLLVFFACLQTPSPPAVASGSFTDSLSVRQAAFLTRAQRTSVKSKQVPADVADSFTSTASINDGNTITVAKSGEADFSTVQAAVDAVPPYNKKRVVIQIAAGTYREKVYIPSNKPYISFVGAGAGTTLITWNDNAASAGGTFYTASVAIDSNFFIARDLSFENSAPHPLPGAIGRQAIALRISGDKAAFYSCNFYGAQDTLCDYQGRHYFKSCFIQGSIDFIFGSGLSYYEDCELHSIATGNGSFLTAQNRMMPNQNSGFSFVNCKVTGSGMIYLGRAWGPYSRVVFLFTYMENIIIPAGWHDFGNSTNQKTAFYGEYECFGPGANSEGRVAWSYQLTAAQAKPFKSLDFIDGASWVQT